MRNLTIFTILVASAFSPISLGGTLIQEDFENGDLSGWSIDKIGLAQETVSWDLVSDISQAWQASGGSSWGHGNSYAYLTNCDVSDVMIRAKVKPVEIRNQGHWSGIVARYIDTTHFYLFSIHDSGTKVWLANINGNQNGDTLGLKELPESVVGVWTTLKLDIRGNHIKAYANDQLCFDLYDNTHASGSAGLANAGAITRFDDVLIYELEPTLILTIPFTILFDECDLSGWDQWDNGPQVVCDNGELTNGSESPTPGANISRTMTLVDLPIRYGFRGKAEENKQADESDYMAVGIGKDEDFYLINLMYGYPSGDPNTTIIRLTSNQNETLLLDKEVPWDNQYHDIEIVGEENGLWKIFYDGSLIGSAIETRFTSFDNVAMAMNNRGAYIDSIWGSVPPCVLSPNGGQQWSSSTKQIISWTSPIGIDKVNLSYSSDDGLTWNEIVSDLPNTGTYEWFVPDITSESCRVRISDALDEHVSDVSSDSITIFVCNMKMSGDINGDCYVNLADFAEIAMQWLYCGNPFDPVCVPYTIDKGLKGYWSFDEGSGNIAGDSTGNGNSGTITGASWTTGISGFALDFNGSIDYVDIANATILNPTQALTVTAWIKVESHPSEWSPVLTHSDWIPSEGTQGYALEFDMNNAGIRFIIDAPIDDESSISDVIPVANDIWAFIAGVYDGSNVQLFVNAVASTPKPCSTSQFQSTGNVYIGRSVAEPSRFFSGAIDEVRIYDRALTQDEVQFLYQNP